LHLECLCFEGALCLNIQGQQALRFFERILQGIYMAEDLNLRQPAVRTWNFLNYKSGHWKVVCWHFQLQTQPSSS